VLFVVVDGHQATAGRLRPVSSFAIGGKRALPQAGWAWITVSSCLFSASDVDLPRSCRPNAFVGHGSWNRVRASGRHPSLGVATGGVPPTALGSTATVGKVIGTGMSSTGRHDVGTSRHCSPEGLAAPASPRYRANLACSITAHTL